MRTAHVRSFRDDMGGTGTWNKECKTLTSRICATPPEPVMLESIVRHFGEFGPLETVRVIKAKGIAFVTYRLRSSAEFAKEAMAEQTRQRRADQCASAPHRRAAPPPP